MADADETAWENVHQESTQELGTIEPHDLRSAVVRVVLIEKGDTVVVHCDKSLIGDGDAMRVAGQVFENLLRSAEWSLGIDDPILAYRLCEELLKRGGLSQRFATAEELQLAGLKQSFESGDKLASKDPAQDTHRQEEFLAFAAAPTGHPMLPIEGHTACRHDAVDVGMVHQVLAPRMKHTQESNLRSQSPWIAGDLQQRLGRCPKQQAVQGPRILER
jgi:hypothetical protein